jgi:putative heme-binding domain-containing protein
MTRRFAWLVMFVAAALAGAAWQPQSGPGSSNLVRFLVPGFVARELPIRLPAINALAYADDGRLFAVGYDGRIHVLTDTDGDGLEDQATIFWDNPPLKTPTAAVWRSEGLYVVSNGKVSLFRGADGKVVEEVVATGWVKDDGVTGGGVDALGLAFDRQGNLFFGLGCADYTNAYRLRDGKTHYDLASERGTIQKVSPDRQRRETICTGIRFPFGLAFNRHGDLFCTDQEGATWLPGGNPLDELNHIVAGKHYGFPPRHDVYLPQVHDQSPVVTFGPQHQSACGLKFNEAGPGGRIFGPKAWEGDALVAGFSRGKVYRCPLKKTANGYQGEAIEIAVLKLLTLDLALAKNGDLTICCHSGPPDWGVGPKAPGKLFRFSCVDPHAPQPVEARAVDAFNVRIAFDRPVMDGYFDLGGCKIRCGEFARPGDGFEVLKPPYKVVREQDQAWRGLIRVVKAAWSADRRTLELATDPHAWDVHYIVELPRSAASSGPLEIGYRLPWPARKPDPPASVAPLSPELQGGNWERGRQVFYSKEANCSACHRVQGQGAAVGPDLSNLVHRDRTSVYRDIVDPNAAINPDYVASNLLLSDGRLIVGLVRAEADGWLRVFDADAKEHRLRRSDIERMEPSAQSLMTTNYRDTLGGEKLKDLLAFLTDAPPTTQARNGPPAPPLRGRDEIEQALRQLGQDEPPTAVNPVTLILVAGPQDHGPGEHDYPGWQRRWSAWLGRAAGVTVETALRWPSTEQWQRANGVLFYDWNHAWSPAQYRQLDEYLARGGGLVMLHAAVIEDKNPENLAQRLGLAAQIGRTKYRHGPLMLKFAGASAPLLGGLGEHPFLDETYWPLIGEPSRVNVLATAVEGGKDHPMAWTFEPGRGRVFCSILGHYSHTFDDPLFRLMVLRGLAWTLRQPPARFHERLWDGSAWASGERSSTER